MRFLFQTIHKLISKELPRPLGRWKIEECSKKMNYKVDLSNENHCGPCGQYLLDKTTSNTKKNPTIGNYVSYK